jgi:hypothetical protein
MMSFKSKDLSIDVLPAKHHPEQGTDEDGGNQPDCDATRPEKVYGASLETGMDLAMLRHQLRERLSPR